ncbi:helix-turn-helix domain-containing protein [Burkholderia pseudomallei]|nr:XRE family transcriptional regulator [Burkholderia pseudomallei]RPE25933.1 XRE family transcriptional regulator [Burkholderia pseudomallei]RQT00105.1 XRE family transcriptional regulator [Burkholderia pseudomallei]RQZ56571.1 XRE family transcriptional regulator [Burkholderia pseudomallei]RSK73004.1 helix-turn-helix domain-containing protein [Burkholderia pseudomallei]
MQTRFGERVRSLRTEHGLKQRELAERMGVDRNLVSGIESGKRSATLRTLQLFCQGLHVSPSDLL